MEGKEPESKYLVLWICVFLTAGIIFVGWFVSLRYNFSTINSEMNGNVTQTFDQAQQEVFASFDEMQNMLDNKEAALKNEAEVATEPPADGIAVEATSGVVVPAVK